MEISSEAAKVARDSIAKETDSSNPGRNEVHFPKGRSQGDLVNSMQ